MPKATFTNGLTEKQEERLHLLIEECAETIQAATKILRHGLYSYHPESPSESNIESLCKEIGHIDAAMALLMKCGIVDFSAVMESRDAKLKTIERWLHH